jgi:hypothetical protein
MAAQDSGNVNVAHGCRLKTRTHRNAARFEIVSRKARHSSGILWFNQYIRQAGTSEAYIYK